MTKVQAQTAPWWVSGPYPSSPSHLGLVPSKFPNRAGSLVFIRAVFKETYFYFPDNEVLNSLPLPRKTHGGGRGG